MHKHSFTGFLKALPLVALCVSVLPEVAQAARVSNPVASFSGLDKITGRITTFDVYVGETVQFGALQVTPKACFNRDETEAQRVDAFVEVDEITLDRKIKRIFTGWMFAESPALNAIEHPIFDVWLKECKKTTSVPPPKDLKIPPNEQPGQPVPSTAPEASQTPQPAAPAPADGTAQPAPTPPAQAPATPAPEVAPVDPAVPPLDAPQTIEEPPISPDAGRAVDPNDGFGDPVPVDPDVEQVPELDQGQDFQQDNPDPNFGLPPEPVPDDGFDQPLQDGDFPPPPPSTNGQPLLQQDNGFQ